MDCPNIVQSYAECTQYTVQSSTVHSTPPPFYTDTGCSFLSLWRKEQRIWHSGANFSICILIQGLQDCNLHRDPTQATVSYVYKLKKEMFVGREQGTWAVGRGHWLWEGDIGCGKGKGTEAGVGARGRG